MGQVRTEPDSSGRPGGNGYKPCGEDVVEGRYGIFSMGGRKWIY